MARSKKLKVPKEPLRYTRAPEVAEIGHRLINEHHKQLLQTLVEFVWKPKATKRQGKVVLGKARIVSGFTAFIANRGVDSFYVIEIAKDEWFYLNAAQRQALVDHELEHCVGPDLDTNKLSLQGHDCEEFNVIIRRHGLWKADVESFAKGAAQQLELLPVDNTNAVKETVNHAVEAINDGVLDTPDLKAAAVVG